MTRARGPRSRGDDGGGADGTSWLARPVPDTSSRGRPWRPEPLRGVRSARLRYVVVDEVFADLAELSISRWPIVDSSGRLRFPRGVTAHVEVDARRMQTFLRRHRMPRKAVGRVLRAGDAFGVTVRGRALSAFVTKHETMPEPERWRMLDPTTWAWLEPPIYDVTSEAREAAKLSYYAALTGPLPRSSFERQ
jgi:hypothetical protein